MTRKAILAILFFLTIFISKGVAALEPFVKDSHNPLNINTANYVNWSDTYRLQPSIIFENGVFKMWYTSSNGVNMKLGYATSPDGIEWTGQTILHPNPAYDNHDPMMVKTQNGYELYFAGSQNGVHYRIYRILSSDGTQFDQGTLQEILAPSLNWETTGISAPYVLYKDSTYYLFYTGWGSFGFNVGLATSTNGSTWTKCSNYILNSADGSWLFEKNGVMYLFFHSASGIESVETTEPLSCTSLWNNRKVILTKGPDSYDKDFAGSPSVIEKSGKYYLYYFSIGNGAFSIDLATSQLTEQKKPIILIPGMFGSWNRNAIIYNQSIQQSDWLVNPIVKEYDAFMSTLNNLGYVLNQDYYLFPYDWRQPLEKTSDELNSFITQKINLNNKAQIVGHSLGGLIGRIYTQKYGSNMIDKLITIGSPHKGTALSYKIVEAGEIERDNSTWWLAEKIILALNKNGLETDRTTFNRIMPLLKDLFPTYDFLKSSQGENIPISSLTIQNTTLQNYSSSFSNLFPYLITFVGEKGNSLDGYMVTSGSVLDTLLGNYPDGKPLQKIQALGDFIITSSSAKADTDFVVSSYDHGELIYRKDAIKSILNNLVISYSDSQVIEGQSTNISPSMIFFIKSPAELEVIDYQNNIYHEQDGIVFIPNAQNGTYSLKVKGKDNGNYTVLMGQIGTEKDAWSSIEGSITSNPPSSQIDMYSIQFDPLSPNQYSYNQDSPLMLLDELKIYLTQLNNNLQNKNISQALTNLNKAKELFQQNNKGSTKSYLLLIHKQLFGSRSSLNDQNKSNILYALAKLENLYTKFLNNYTFGLIPSRLEQSFKMYKAMIVPTQSFLFSKKQSGKNVLKNTQILIEIESRVNSTEQALKDKKYIQAEILLKTIEELVKEVRKF